MEKDVLAKFGVSLYLNDAIEVVDDHYLVDESPSQISLLKKKGFKQSFIDGIMKVNKCKFEWFDPNDTNIRGIVNILSIKDIVKSTASYDYAAEEDPIFKHFHLVDNVVPEIGIGIFSGEYATNSLYLEEADGVAQYLGLDMEGYIKMLIATRGFYCWQFALMEYKSKDERHAFKQLKEHLPRLFPEVNIDEVFALYDSLYINEPEPASETDDETLSDPSELGSQLDIIHHKLLNTYKDGNAIFNRLQFDNGHQQSDASHFEPLEKKGFKPSFINAISEFDNWAIGWKELNNEDASWGITHVLPIKQIVASSKRFEKLAKKNPVFKHFHIVDNTVLKTIIHNRLTYGQTETIAGIFSGKYATNSLYLKEKDKPLAYLGLDMAGYRKLAFATYGFMDWQRALIDYRNEVHDSPALIRMREHLPRLFEEVNMDDIFALYDSLYFEEPQPNIFTEPDPELEPYALRDSYLEAIAMITGYRQQFTMRDTHLKAIALINGNSQLFTMREDNKYEQSLPEDFAELEKKGFKQSFIHCISRLDNWGLAWGKYLYGRTRWGAVKVLPIKEIISSTKTYAKLAKNNPVFEHFHKVDAISTKTNFVNSENFPETETSVGIFSGKYASNSLYYLDDENNLFYLGLDMEGYAKMSIAFYGYVYWQLTLIEYKKHGLDYVLENYSALCRYLPEIFPHVNINEVFALYDSLYISEETVPGAE